MQLSFATCLTAFLTISQALPTTRNTGSCSDVGISNAAAVSSAFSKAKIVPQVIPAINPKVQVRVSYNGKQVNLGNTFAVAETVTEPQITFSAESDHDPATTKYTILMFDPDAPSPTSGGQPALLSPFLHLGVNDASPACINPATYGGGKVSAIYKSPTPLSVAQHRYIQLVYRQPPNFTPPFSLAAFAGAKFDLAGYTKDLTLVGGNYYLEGLGNVV